MPLGTAEEATSVRPTISVPVSVERDFYGRNVVQVSGPIASQSGAGFVGAGQSVPVPTGQTDTAVGGGVRWYPCRWTWYASTFDAGSFRQFISADCTVMVRLA